MSLVVSLAFNPVGRRFFVPAALSPVVSRWLPGLSGPGDRQRIPEIKQFATEMLPLNGLKPIRKVKRGLTLKAWKGQTSNQEASQFGARKGVL